MQPRLEQAVGVMQEVILLGRRKREEERINLRTPLKRLTVIHREQALLDDVRDLGDYVRAELNVKEVTYDEHEDRYIDLSARPNFPVLGKRLGNRMKEFQQMIRDLDRDQIDAFLQTGSLELGGETFDKTEIDVVREARQGTSATSSGSISIDLDCGLDPALIAEGLAREVVNRIQRGRKELQLHVADRIRVTYDGDAALLDAIATHSDYIGRETLAVELRQGDPGTKALASEVDGAAFRYLIERN